MRVGPWLLKGAPRLWTPLHEGRSLGLGFYTPGLFCSCPGSGRVLLKPTYGVPLAPPLPAQLLARRGPAYLGFVVKVALQTPKLGSALTVVPPLGNPRGYGYSGENSLGTLPVSCHLRSVYQSQVHLKAGLG